MDSNTETVLRVREVFHFASGVVVVVGPASGDPGNLRAGAKASVWVRGERTGTVEVVGERMPGPGTPTYRTVETRGDLAWDKVAIAEGECELRW